jgi:hypothetical protein
VALGNAGIDLPDGLTIFEAIRRDCNILADRKAGQNSNDT